MVFAQLLRSASTSRGFDIPERPSIPTGLARSESSCFVMSS